MSISRRQLILFGIPTLTALASPIFAEASFRVAGVRTAQTMGGVYLQLPNRGYAHRPESRVFMNWYPKGFTVRTDTIGMRIPVDGTHAYTTGTTIDVLVVGDSQAFGNGVEAEQTIPGQLAIAASKHGWTVSNAAVGGHFLGNQLQLLESLRDNHNVRCRVVLLLATPRMLSNPSAFADAYVQDGNLYSSRPRHTTLLRHWLSTHSAAYVVLRNAARHFIADSGESFANLIAMYRSGGVTAFEREKALSAQFHRFSDIARSMGGRLAAAYLPFDVERDIDRLAKASGVTDVLGSVLRDTASRVSAATGAPFIDVTAALDAVRGESGRVTLEGDPHYNAAASARCARAIWDAIVWPEHSNWVGRVP